MKRTTVQLTQAQHAAILKLARERHGGSQSAALREVVAAGAALLGGDDPKTAAARAGWEESYIDAARKAHEAIGRSV